MFLNIRACAFRHIFSIVLMKQFFVRCVLLSGLIFFFGTQRSAAQFLFDATKAEMAGNADWVIDADLHNLNVTNGNGSGKTGGSDSNPQITPTPAASGITSSTSETYWTGGISAWGVSLVKAGQSVSTLPYNGSITYGNSSNAQDLSHYKVFVLCEPNILFTTAEKTALSNFVLNGGSLFMVADHGGSDRNNDGSDSTQVWNDFLSSTNIGISFNGDDLATSPNAKADSSASDPITHGSAGTISAFAYADGSTITINPTKNSTAKVAVWATATTSNSNALVAYANYGLGRVVAIGDSSPFDDGTGDPGDTLYDGWDDANGNDGQLIMNASLWLAAPEPNAGMLAALAGGAFLLRRRVVRR
jgi:hypothetical protein